MKTERARLINDYSIIGEGIPMLSASQQPLTLDDVVYTGEADVSGYDDKKEVKYEVTAWRVIQVNYRDRYVRIRNPGGCEMTVSYSESCPRLKLYHDFAMLRAKLLEMVAQQRRITEEKIDVRKRLMSDLDDTAKAIEKMKPPQPPVKTERVVKAKA